MKKIFLFAMLSIVSVLGMRAQTDAQYDAAVAAITDGNYGIVAVYNSQTYLLKADGYLTDDAYGVGTFAVSQTTGGQVKDTGFRISSTSRFTNGGNNSNVVTSRNHLAVTTNDRADFERQILYRNDEGNYAVRTTNSTSTSWGASSYWTVVEDNDADYLPNASYSLDPVYVWKLIPESEFSDVLTQVANNRKNRILTQLNSYKNDAAYTNDKTNLTTAIAAIEAASTIEEIHNATADIATIVSEYSYANANYPIDKTSLITNSSFETDGGAGWTMDAGNKNLHGGANGNYCAESWQSAFTLSQTIELPNGYYRVRAQAALTDYTNAYDGANYPVVYAADQTATFKEMQGDDRSSNMSKLSVSFSNERYFTDWTPAVKVTGKSLTIGVKGTRTNTWCIWDNFRLQYLGPIDLSEFVQGLADAVTAAEAYESQLPSAVYANIASVITENNKSYEDSEGYSNAIVAINNAVSTYATAAIIADYARYQGVKTAALAISSNVDVTDADAAVEAATTTDAIDAAIASLRTAFLTVLPNVTVPTDPGYIDVTAVMVDNAGVHYNTNYWTMADVEDTWGSVGVCNYGECEFYNHNFRFYQTLSLIRGTWEFGVTGFHRAGNHNTHFYAGEDQILIPGVANSVVNSMAEAETYFDNGNGKVSLKFLIEEAQNVEIGINNEDTETDKWTIFRDFTLKYYGAPDYSVYDDQWEATLATANEAKAADAYKNVTGKELTALNAAIADAPDGSSKANYLEKIQALDAATVTFKTAAASYDAFAAAKNLTLAYGVKSADLTAAQNVTPTDAADAVTKTSAINALLPAYYESHALAEGVQGAKNMTYKVGQANAPASQAEITAWTYSDNIEDTDAKINSNEQFTQADGTTGGAYYDGGDLWGQSAYEANYKQNVLLAPGKYLLTVTSRASQDTKKFELYAGEETTEMVKIGAGEGDGVFGRGWNDQSVEFEVTGATAQTVEIGVNIEQDKIHNWYSFTRFRLVQLESSAAEGDVDGDGTVEDADLSNLVNYLVGKNATAVDPDVDGDGKVSLSDITKMVNILKNK